MRRDAACIDTGRRRLAAALLGLAWPGARAAEALAITALSSSGDSAIAALLLADIYRRAGLSLNIEVLPPARASRSSASGTSDGELFRIAGYGQLHPELVRIDPAYYRVSVRGYALPERGASLRTREDLRQYSVGVVRGMLFVQELAEQLPTLTLTQSAPQLFRMLQAGRIDVALCTGLTAQTAIRDLGAIALEASPELLRLELHHYLHARHEALAPRLGGLIRRLRDNGQLEQLTRAYAASVNA